MSTFVKKSKIPETITGAEGTAKRNIIRKGGSVVKSGRKDGVTGQTIDDGSNHYNVHALDEYDPNYDSEEETGKEFIPKYAALHRDDVAKSSITLTAYKKKIEPIIAEFFLNGDIDNVASSIEDINEPEYMYEFVKRIINKSCDKNDKERELVSQLLSNLYPHIISSNMLGKGFERLFEILDEIEKDAPAATNILAIYLARAVADEILPPSFLADNVVCKLGGEVVVLAKHMLSRDHGGAKLERSWGPGDGRPVEEMKVVIDQILQEYLISNDLEEAVFCISELKSPHFYHEIIKRAINNCLDKTKEQQEQMSLLLNKLTANGLLSTQQAEKGFNRLFNSLPDLVLDTPNAKDILNEFIIRAKQDNVLTNSYQPTIVENLNAD